MTGQDPSFTVSEFVAIFNQSIEMLYPQISIVGEISNFRVSKGKWVYFDLKDEYSSVKFFGNVFSLPGPLEDGMKCEVFGKPRLHNLYGFSVNFTQIRPVGEGSLKKAKDLLARKLEAEGLFAPERKRQLPYPPSRVGVVTSAESAAISDFLKIINNRWPSLEIELADTLVQGASSPAAIVKAIQEINMLSNPPEVLILIRGGGSADDLAAFSEETVVRAVASSRIPTLVAIGHEKDISLAELAADRRASTPSNAAELLVPDIQNELRDINSIRQSLNQQLRQKLSSETEELNQSRADLNRSLADTFRNEKINLKNLKNLIDALNPLLPLQQGYVILRDEKKQIKSSTEVQIGNKYDLQFAGGHRNAKIV